MKKLRNSIIILTTLLTLLTGCTDIVNPVQKEEAPPLPPTGTGRLTFVIPGNGGRTIIPQSPVLTKYVFSFEAFKGPLQSSETIISDIEVDVAGPSEKMVDVYLPPGNWLIKARGLVTINGVDGIPNGEYPAAEGQYAVNVLSGKSYTVTIDLGATQTAGKGVLAWDITIPNAGTVSTATMTLLDLDGNALVGFIPVNVKANPQGSIGVAAGFFILTLAVDGVLQHVEVIQIYSGRNSLYESH
jgi:hypothetical protein